MLREKIDFKENDIIYLNFLLFFLFYLLFICFDYQIAICQLIFIYQFFLKSLILLLYILWNTVFQLFQNLGNFHICFYIQFITPLNLMVGVMANVVNYQNLVLRIESLYIYTFFYTFDNFRFIQFVVTISLASSSSVLTFNSLARDY